MAQASEEVSDCLSLNFRLLEAQMEASIYCNRQLFSRDHKTGSGRNTIVLTILIPSVSYETGCYAMMYSCKQIPTVCPRWGRRVMPDEHQTTSSSNDSVFASL